jgi:hypothetical protein
LDKESKNDVLTGLGDDAPCTPVEYCDVLTLKKDS